MSSMKMKCLTEMKMKRYISTKGIKIKIPQIHMGMVMAKDTKSYTQNTLSIIMIMVEVKEDAKDTEKAAKTLKETLRGDERKEASLRS